MLDREIESFRQVVEVVPEDELFLVEPFLPAGGKAILHGKRGHGKSALSMTLALAVVRGESFLGRYPCPRPGPVVLIGCDMTPRLQYDRVSRFVGSNADAPIDDLYALRFDSRIDILEAAGARSAPRWADQLRQIAPALVVVDTLRNTHRMDENANDTPGLIYDAWRRVAGPAALMFLHHDRKTFEGSNSDEDFRGAGAWFDEIDVGLHMIKTKKHGFRLEFSRVRTCDDQETIKLTLDEKALTLRETDVMPVEAEIERMVRAGVPKVEIVAMAIDHDRWNSGALSKPTAYRRLDGYVPGEVFSFSHPART